MKTEEETSADEENVVSPLKPFLLGILGLAVVMAILVLLPMLFTYLSSGDTRAPSQIHDPDPVGKTNQTVYKGLNPKK
jgi:Na+-transporting methylmalonyl-CoA/oxaloacetate decarboxylase gamma subunit